MSVVNTREGERLIGWAGHWLTLLGLLMIIAVQSACSKSASAQGDQITCPPVAGAKKIATAKLFIEHNATDQDTGVHGAFDDVGWSRLCVFDPTGRQVLGVKPEGQLGDLTLGGIFFESREPPNSEFSLADLKAAFPQGRYEVRATSFDGRGLTGFATFTHDIPAEPLITSPLEDAVVSVNNLAIEWNDVTATIDGRAITITGYEVIITKDVRDDPNGFSRPTFDVHVPPDRNRLSVPVEFLESHTTYELEVLALEKSGNQTISVRFFKTQ